MAQYIAQTGSCTTMSCATANGAILKLKTVVTEFPLRHYQPLSALTFNAMNKVVHFEIPADDLAASQDFYKNVFGWEFKKWDENYVTVTTTPTDASGKVTEPGGINGGLQRRGDRAVAPTIVIETDDIDATLKEVYAQGGTVAIQKESIGDMGHYAQFDDPAGNRIGLFQPNM